jgi:DNA-binding CsgD family transcriptional regulator
VEAPPRTGLLLHALTPIGPDAVRLALIERGQAWKVGSQAIGYARGGTGAAVLLEGASGMGKTGLIVAIRALALESGMQVLTAAGRRRERNLSFGVVLQLLEARGRDAAQLEPFAPGPTVGNGHDITLTAIPSFYRLCAKLAAEKSLILLIDDADLADEQSLRSLLYLTERLSALPLALFLTAGSVAPTRAPRVLAEIARHPSTARVRLKPLSARGTARRVGKTTLSASAHEASDEIHRASGGNPFVVDLLAKGFAEAEEFGEEAPEATVRGLAAPGIAEWALVRAAELDPGAPGLLTAIAVLRSDCEPRHAAALAGLDPETAGELVDALTDIEILAPTERLSFAQPAVAAEIERAQTPTARGASNLRAARLLADDGEPPERVADHLLMATRNGSASTVEALCAAAEVALGRGQPQAAVQYLRRALEEPPRGPHRAHVISELGRAEAIVAEPDAAIHLTDGLAKLVDRREDPRAALATVRTLFALGRYAEALSPLERAVSVKGDIDPGTASSIAAAHTTARWLASLANGRSFKLTPPPTSADTVADRDLFALHAIEAALRGKPAKQVCELAESALGGGQLLRDETSDGLMYYLAAAALAYAGDLQLAEAALTAAVRDAKARGSLLGFATASHARARTVLRRGRLQDAARDARLALAIERDGWRKGTGDAHVALAHTLIQRGNPEGARRHLDAAERSTSDTDPFRVLLMFAQGRLALHSGEAERAFDFFTACGQRAERAGVANPAVVPWRADAGLAAAAIGDSGEAELLIESELALASEFGEPGAIGRALHAMGLVRPPERGLEAFEAAVEMLEDSQAALERAGALVDFGAALRRSGRRRDAREPLKAGLDLAERCGATVLAARAWDEVKAAGARPRRTALHGREALTAREHQVAALAAAGLSNREIAKRLVVTVKTVEWHLKHSYVKLGVTSRRELGSKLGDDEAS